LSATALVAAISDASAFKNGRQCAAWLGLVPRQHATGGKERLLGMSKRGDNYLRKLLIHGARATPRWVGRKPDRRSHWLRQLVERRGKNRTAVAVGEQKCPDCLGAVDKPPGLSASHELKPMEEWGSPRASVRQGWRQQGDNECQA